MVALAAALNRDFPRWPRKSANDSDVLGKPEVSTWFAGGRLHVWSPRGRAGHFSLAKYSFGAGFEAQSLARAFIELPSHSVELRMRTAGGSQRKKPVMNYPKDIKPFYMRVNDDGRTVAAMDALSPGIGEIIGGSQREERLEVLDTRMAERGIDKEHYGWYRDLRRYGTVPHAGFGLGFEPTIAYVTGLSNVRDAIPFPRTPGNARY
jgi:tRNA synthetases class II (D, K and N)